MATERAPKGPKELADAALTVMAEFWPESIEDEHEQSLMDSENSVGGDQ